MIAHLFSWIGISLLASVQAFSGEELPLNQGWSFHRVENAGEPTLDGAAVSAAFDESTWEQVTIPHTAKVESPYCGEHYFKGICWYRRTIPVAPDWKGKQVSAVFDGAMQRADVWVNGKPALTHLGGYLPFAVDLTPYVNQGGPITLALRLDNSASPDFPPGSNRIDFVYYGGLYRPARLVVTDPVHLTHAVSTDAVAGGGVFACTTSLTKDRAELAVRAHVRNDGTRSEDIRVEHSLLSPSGKVLATAFEEHAQLAPATDIALTSKLAVSDPLTWHPDHPWLHRVVTVVKRGGVICDRKETRCGIRSVACSDAGFILNGEPIVLRGANRHMSFPYLGNAGSDNMQFRDIRLLKEAGFNFVRLCHYPQSTATMDACDELGVLALVCTPGWQCFPNNESFRSCAKRNIREMVRWHRNHPSAALWEVSLNESAGHDDFYAECCDIARQEFPGGTLLTSGDSHGSNKVRHYDLTYTGWEGFYKRPPHQDARIAKGLHREYGDYEFGGQSSSTRVRRDAGEDKLLLQAWNLQWSHNRNLAMPHTLGDSIWAGIDNPSTFDQLDAQGRGLGSCWGPLDLCRLPKFSYYFYQSQRDPDVRLKSSDSGPMVHIAEWWTPRPSPAKVVVYSNCDEVELFLNGKSIARRCPDHGPDTDYGAYRPEADPMYWTKKQDSFEATQEAEKNAKGKGMAMFDGGNCQHLDHAPFTFVPVEFAPGELKAIAYRKGAKVAEHLLRTPGKPAKLRLIAPDCGRPLAADGADALFVHVEVTDENGVVIPDSSADIRCRVRGAGGLIGSDRVQSQAGIASFLVQATTTPGEITVSAESEGLPATTLTLRSSTVSQKP